MEELDNTMIGRGRDAIDMIIDKDSFQENIIDGYSFDPDYGPGSVVGTAKLNGKPTTIIANDAMAFNDRFPVVFGGVIGLGNGPGKMEEIAGMNKSTGGYQLALAEARKAGHPIVAMVIGRAISGAFLCHGLQADHILALSKDFGTMIHVMPLTSIARITKMDIERLEELSTSNPVFAAGVDFFYKLGGVQEIVNQVEDMREVIIRHIDEVAKLKAEGKGELLGPWGRGILGNERGGRTHRMEAIAKVNAEFAAVADKYINA